MGCIALRYVIFCVLSLFHEYERRLRVGRSLLGSISSLATVHRFLARVRVHSTLLSNHSSFSNRS